MTSAPAARDERKQLGAYYSPERLAAALVAWAVRSPADEVLEPACGDGIFVSLAAERLAQLGAAPSEIAGRLRAVDVNPEAAARTRSMLHAHLRDLGALDVNVRAVNFFELDPPGTLFGEQPIDAVIGNPPYVRSAMLDARTRELSRTRTRDAGVSLPDNASLWAHFVVGAVGFLRRGGRLAFVLPGEFLRSVYAEPLRTFLRTSFAEVGVVEVQGEFFEAQQDVVLLLARGRGEAPRRLVLAELPDIEDAPDLDEALARGEGFAAGEDPPRWTARDQEREEAVELDHLVARGAFLPLGSIARVTLGFISGANDYFVLKADEVEQFRIPTASLRPALLHARQLRTLRINDALLRDLKSSGDRCELWYPPASKDAMSAEDRNYLWIGDCKGINERYKCLVRQPWWRVPGLIAPHAVFTSMSDLVPRICLVETKIYAGNTLLGVLMERLTADERLDVVMGFYNSATMLSCERTGRTYGGGVLQMRPRELGRALVPSPRLLAEVRPTLRALAPALDRALGEGNAAAAGMLAELDEVLLAAAGVPEPRRRALGAAWRRATDRRRRRS